MTEALAAAGMDVSTLQADPDHPTGRSYVSFTATGEPQYEIDRHAAWDWIQFDPDLEELARHCDAVCFGTLAQRSAQSRSSIYRFLGEARRAVRLFDVNLRGEGVDRQALQKSCELSTMVKASAPEMQQLGEVLGLPAPSDPSVDPAEAYARAMLTRFDVRAALLTRGPEGTVALTSDGRVEGQQAHYDQAANADPVGAGDACCAAFLVGSVLRLHIEQSLTLANHVGAFVAAQPGATPVLPDAILKRL